MKTYKVVRTIKEEFEVYAENRDDARLKIEDPHTVTVIKEVITLVKKEKYERT